MPRYTAHYIARLLAQRDYDALVDLQGAALGWGDIDTSLPNFGLPRPVFVVFEMLTWLAQADRSGVWTYYEATPAARKESVLATLVLLGAVDLQQQYAYGNVHWHDTEAMRELDHWICKNEQTIIDWSFTVLTEHPTELALVCS